MPSRKAALYLRIVAILTLAATVFPGPWSARRSLAQEGGEGGDVDAYVDALMADMTVAEKVGQLFVVTFAGDDLGLDTQIANLLANYKVGGVKLLDANGRTGEPGPGTRPLDMDVSDDGRFLYTLDIGSDTITAFRVQPDGSLRHAGQFAGVPGANGLAAR